MTFGLVGITCSFLWSCFTNNLSWDCKITVFLVILRLVCTLVCTHMAYFGWKSLQTWIILEPTWIILDQIKGNLSKRNYGFDQYFSCFHMLGIQKYLLKLGMSIIRIKSRLIKIKSKPKYDHYLFMDFGWCIQ